MFLLMDVSVDRVSSDDASQRLTVVNKYKRS